MKVILLCGSARSGKTTFAGFLKEELEKENKKVCMLEYSDYIKYYIMKYFGWNGNDLEKPREFMQHLSTEIIRKKVNKNFLVNRTIEDIKVLSHFFDIAIVSGVREESEITLPKKEFSDCISIKIERDNYDNDLSERAKAHYTEKALDNYQDYDYIIKNNSTLNELKVKAKNLKEVL